MLVVNFFLFRVLPGDPARTLGRGRLSSPEQLAEFNRTYGLDEPTGQQFVTFVTNLAHGDLGYSILYHRDVSGILLDRMWPTLLLVGTATVLAALIGVWLGIRSRLGARREVRPVLDRHVADPLLDARVVAGAAAHRGVRGRHRADARPVPDGRAALGGRRPGVPVRACSTPSGT